MYCVITVNAGGADHYLASCITSHNVITFWSEFCNLDSNANFLLGLTNLHSLEGLALQLSNSYSGQGFL